ncbi:MAG: hypothetical protein H7282_02605 [Cytophagaceae bacterium]|nr:hypothetical protein [Cytophagaceae bacterium]
MKPFKKLSNIEKARLLFELFPDEMPSLTLFIKVLTLSILDNPAILQNRPSDQLHTTQFWMELVADAKGVFKMYEKKLSKSSRLFSEKFFCGYNSIYAGFCLHQYLLSNDSMNKKLRTAIQLLFF